MLTRADPTTVDVVKIDLRAECRAASAERQAESSAKSPKKKLFSSIRNPFTKNSANVAPPQMPPKAAQVFGTAARQPKTITVRPIKPARPFEPTPTKPARSDTSKSLPAKVVDPDNYAHRHRSGSSRRHRPIGRGSPSGGSPTKQSSDAENAPPVPKFNISFESIIPPTPPAKDTPPDQRAASPLRRVAPAHDLRESYSESVGESYQDNYGSYVDKDVNLRYPDFALSPLPSSDVLPGHGGASPTGPTKFRPYTADDYTKLIEGEALQWPYPERGDSLKKPEDKRSAAHMVSPMFETPKLRRPDRRSAEREGSNRQNSEYSPLQPRFYSPKHLSARGFAEGESPSKNVSAPSFLLSLVEKWGHSPCTCLAASGTSCLHLLRPQFFFSLTCAIVLLTKTDNTTSLTLAACSTQSLRSRSRSSIYAKTRTTDQSK
jgi:hypothetical protein